MSGSFTHESIDASSARGFRALFVLLATALFGLDIAAPLGVATAVPYVAVVLLSLLLPGRRDVLYFAIGCSILTLAGILFSPGAGGTEAWKWVANRVLALFAIWATAILGNLRHVDQTTLGVVRERLQEEGREHAAAQAEDQARLSGIIQSAMDGIITLDSEGMIVLFNRAAEQIFGVGASDAIGKPLDRFLPERFRVKHPELIREFGKSGETSRRVGSLGQALGLRSDGTEFPIEVSISQVEYGGEKLYTAILHDITERKRTEQELAARAEQESVIADLGQRALLGASLKSRVRDSVEAVSRTLDVEYVMVLERLPAEAGLRLVAGVGWREGLVGELIVSSEPDSRAGYTLSVDHPVVVTDLPSEERFSGPPLLLEHGVRSGISVVIGADERPYGVLDVYTKQSRSFGENDVDFVQAIANLIGLAYRRSRAEEALRVTKKRAREAEELASVSTITAGIAHDIGTPMNTIMGYADMLERGLVDPKSRERATIIKTQVVRIARLVDALLNMARPAKGSMIMIDLEDVIDASLSFFREKLKKHGISVERNLEPVPRVRGCPDRLQQVFLNLFVNATDAMPDGGTLSVSLRSSGPDDVEVHVRDSGSGIASEDIELIFEPFFTTKKRGEGTGLGLLVSKGIVVDHGGTIDVRSELGSGAEFRIVLPVEGRVQPSGAS